MFKIDEEIIIDGRTTWIESESVFSLSPLVALDKHWMVVMSILNNFPGFTPF